MRIFIVDYVMTSMKETFAEAGNVVVAASAHIGEVSALHDVTDHHDACYEVILSLLYKLVNTGELDVENFLEPESLVVKHIPPPPPGLPPPLSGGQSQSSAQHRGSVKAASTTATTTTTVLRT